jgi:hypothetical protein
MQLTGIHLNCVNVRNIFRIYNIFSLSARQFILYVYNFKSRLMALAGQRVRSNDVFDPEKATWKD